MKHSKTPVFSLSGLIPFIKERFLEFIRFCKEHLPRRFDKDILLSLCKEHLPNHKDNIFQMAVKVAFVILIIGSVVTTSCFFDYFSDIKEGQQVVKSWTDIWDSELNDIDSVSDRSKANIYKLLNDKNDDFEAWLKISSGSISAPVFKSDDNDYYKTHNCNKEKSKNGALYFDKSVFLSSGDQRFNTVIYGNNTDDGTLFGNLEKFREANFFCTNYSLALYHPEKTGTYKIFASFIYDPKDDFKLFDSIIVSDSDFDKWIEEIYARSFVITEIPVQRSDNFLTLVTDCSDYPGAKTVVMARKVRSGETTYISPSEFALNAMPQLPKK